MKSEAAWSPRGDNSSEQDNTASDLRVVAIGGGTGLSTPLKGLKRYVLTPLSPLPARPPFASCAAWLRSATMGDQAAGFAKSSTCFRRATCATASLRSRKTKLCSRGCFNIAFRRVPGSRVTASAIFFLPRSLRSRGISLRRSVSRLRFCSLADTFFLPQPLSVELEARFEDGTRVRGETRITASKGKIRELFLVPPDVLPLPQTLDAIATADLITIGPGSLFTSLIPNLLVGGIVDAIVELECRQGIYLQPDDAGE